MKNLMKKIGREFMAVCLTGTVALTMGTGSVHADAADMSKGPITNKAAVLYVNNLLAFTPAYKVQMDKTSVMLATRDDAVAMLDLVQKKYNDDDSYSVRLVHDADASGNEEQYKTVILPSGQKENEALTAVSFKEDVTVKPANAEVSKVLTVKEAVDKVTKKKDAKLSVVTKEKEKYREKYNKKVKYVKTKSLLKGQKKVKTKGKAGVRKVDAMVTYTNGKETNRKILDQDVIKEAEAKTVLVGTKEPDTFIKPMNHITVSSNFGSRWGRQHQGVDFSSPVGTPVMASRSGKVTYAGWMSGYGYCVLIRHEDGYQTRYAHLNSIHVSVGQSVSQGDKIALSGNTGRSTGPHLHFEIIKNGAAVNPMNYLS